MLQANKSPNCVGQISSPSLHMDGHLGLRRLWHRNYSGSPHEKHRRQPFVPNWNADPGVATEREGGKEAKRLAEEQQTKWNSTKPPHHGSRINYSIWRERTRRVCLLYSDNKPCSIKNNNYIVITHVTCNSTFVVLNEYYIKCTLTDDKDCESVL